MGRRVTGSALVAFNNNSFRKLNLHERQKTHRDFVPTNRYFAKLNIY